MSPVTIRRRIGACWPPPAYGVSMKRIRLAPLAVIAVLAMGLLAGCAGDADGAGGASGSSSSLSDSAAKDSAGDAIDAPRADGSEAFAPAQEPMAGPNVAQQHIITTADVSLQADHPEAAAEEVAQVAQRLGGSVESLSMYRATGEAPAGAQLTVRVPPAQLDAAIEQFAEIGEVTSQSRTTQDVTTEYVDLEARIKALETSIKRLTDLMAGAATTSDLIAAEGALTQRQQELDGLRAQLKALDGQVSESTIWVTITAAVAAGGGGHCRRHRDYCAGSKVPSSTRCAARRPDSNAAVTVAGSSCHVASPASCSTRPTGVASAVCASGGVPGLA